MKKLIAWFKTVNQNAKIRAQLILTARERMACMEAHWRQEADKSNDAVSVMLMSLGLCLIDSIYQAEMAAQNVIRSRQAPLN